MFSGGFSIWHWLIVGLVVLLLFGKGRFSDMMGDVAKGLKNFKKGMSEDEEAEQRRLTAERAAQAAPPAVPAAAAPAEPVAPAQPAAAPTPEADRRQA
jgi:sec-independent protein translocase protein TatA